LEEMAMSLLQKLLIKDREIEFSGDYYLVSVEEKHTQKV
jgi:hypothetical protein